MGLQLIFIFVVLIVIDRGPHLALLRWNGLEKVGERGEQFPRQFDHCLSSLGCGFVCGQECQFECGLKTESRLTWLIGVYITVLVLLGPLSHVLPR